MPMTAMMSQIANTLEAQFRPGLASFVERQYRERAAKAPTELRTKEIVDVCLNRMRLKLEECHDMNLQTPEVSNHCLLAIRLALADELDKEFPKIVLATS